MNNNKLIIALLLSIVISLMYLDLPTLIFVLLILGIVIFVISIFNIEGVILVITLSRATLDCLRDVFRIGPINITSFFSIFIILFGIVYFCLRMRSIKYLNIFMPILIFLGICFASIFYSPSKTGSIEEFIRIASYVTLSLLIANVFNTKEKIKRFIKYYFGSLIIPLAVGFYQYFMKSGLSYYGYNRLYATLQHPSSYVKYLNIFLIICSVFMIMSNKTNKSKKWCYCLFIILLFQIFATFTRAGWIEAVIGLCLIFWFTRRRSLIIAVLAGVVILFSLPFVKERFSSEIKYFHTNTIELPAEAYLQGSIKSRFQFNEFLFKKMFIKSPLSGTGIGSFYYYYAPEYFGIQIESHGDLTKLLGEVGIIGTMLFIFGMARIGYFIFIKLKYVKDYLLYNIMLSAVCLIILRIFIQNFDAELRLVLVQWYYWSLYGIALACSHIYGEEEAKENISRNC
ncbi:MAG: O-antigen ligase family protein [Candidatus Omnitrophota bacterium]